MELKQDKAPTIISQGIDTLIEQLKSEGVNAGEMEAQHLIKEAKEKANEIVNNAQAQAQQLIEEAHQTALREKKATEDALALAARNMRLELRQTLIDRFTQEVKRLVHKELNHEDLLRQLILMVVADTKEQLKTFNEEQIEIQLPEKVLDFEEIRKDPKLLDKDPLKGIVQSITHQMLREGMSVKINSNINNLAGVKIHLVNNEIVLDLTEEAISNLLIKHMQPRFRALLEGLLQ